ncbi:MAG: type II secretion system minor pseudopilin GspH [Steroidobacteraceae bacterium]
MRISATGIWTSSPRRRSAGFTLIEILVVLLIIGIMIAGAVLSLGVTGGDRDLDRERERILALTDYLRDQAGLQNREYGMRCFIGGYEFLVFEPRSGRWQRIEGDTATRVRHLATGLVMELSIEGRDIVLPRETVKEEDLVPQIMLYSSGDLNLFELTLRREQAAGGVRFAPSPSSDRVDATDLAGAT